MGGKKSKAPPAPDYAAAAQAQGAADKATAQYTTALDRPTQVNPYGQTTWSFGGQGAQATAANQQAIKSAQDQLAKAQAMATTVPGQRSGQVETSKFLVNKRNSAIAAAQAQLASAQKPVGGAAGSTANPLPGDWKQITSLSPQEQAIFNAEQQNRLGMENLTDMGISRVGSTIDKEFSPNISNFDVAQGLRAGNVALPQYQGMGAAPGMAADTTKAAGYNQQLNAPGMGADRVGLAGNTLEGLQDVNESADQFGAQGQQVRDALYQQMTQFSDDRFGRAEQQERSRLAQMGLQEGSEAYRNALSEFNRSKDESYQTAQLNAILAGGGEQSRMIADQLASRQSNIGLRQGQFGQNMARDQMDAAERAQTYGASANQYAQNQGERQFGFGAGLALDQQDMAERAQTYGAAAGQYGQNQSERMNQFSTGAQRYGIDQSERQAMATSELNLANQAAAQRQQMFNEEAYKRSLPINEVSALLGGGGVNMPNFPGFAPSTPFASPDMLGAANAQYGAAMNKYNAGQSQKGGLLGAGAGMLGSFMGGK